MAEVPSLSEIANVSVNPNLGGVDPSTVIDTGDIARNLLEAANHKSANDWNKLNLVLENKQKLFSKLENIQQFETADQDKPHLKRQAAEIFEEISKNPRAFFGGQKMDEINARLSKLQADATSSKQSKAEDWFWKTYVSQYPEYATDENKKKIEDYWKQPLGERKSYMITPNHVFDAETVAKGLLENPAVTKKFSDIQNVGEDLKTPGNKFIKEEEGIQYDQQAFEKLAKIGLSAPDKYGRPLKDAVKGVYNQLPENVKKYYDKKGGEEGYYLDLMKSYFPKDTRVVTKSSAKQNEFALKRQEAEDKLKQMGVKFDYDKALLALKKGAEKDILQFKESLVGLRNEQKYQALDNLIDTQFDEAESNPVGDIAEKALGEDYKDQYKLDVATKAFDIEEQGIGNKKLKVSPAVILLNKDKDKVTTIYFGKDGKTVDPSKTKTFTADEYKLRIGKELFGSQGLAKQTEGNRDKKPDTQTKTKTITYKGKTFTEDQLSKAAKASEMNIKDYKKQLGIN